jgi:hypothetical protein
MTPTAGVSCRTVQIAIVRGPANPCKRQRRSNYTAAIWSFTRRRAAFSSIEIDFRLSHKLASIRSFPHFFAGALLAVAIISAVPAEAASALDRAAAPASRRPVPTAYGAMRPGGRATRYNGDSWSHHA